MTEEEFQTAIQQLDALVQEFESLPFPEVREMAFSLLQAVDVVHREGLSRLIGFLRDEREAELVDRAAEDPIIHTLLVLYDLVPVDEITQVEQALATIRPYIHSHGGEVEVLGVVDGVVHLRLAGSCHGCVGSTMTLKRGIEAALREGFAGLKGIEVHDSKPVPTSQPAPIPGAGGFISLDQLEHETKRRKPRRPLFQDVARLEDVPAETMYLLRLTHEQDSDRRYGQHPAA